MPLLAPPSLADVPLEERRRAARKVCAELAQDGGWAALNEAIDVMRAALFPESADPDDTLDD